VRVFRLAAVGDRVGVAGVVAALSVVSDLARGHPPGEAMRACLLATELARRAGLDGRGQGEVYYGTLMRFAGCAATSHEIAAVFGGDDMSSCVDSRWSRVVYAVCITEHRAPSTDMHGCRLESDCGVERPDQGDLHAAAGGSVLAG
jgi:hypothetical protein